MISAEAKRRKEKGILAPFALLALIIAAFAVLALGLDLAHMVYVQNELQTATDAAALSGAQRLADGAGVAEQRAYDVCAMNTANGKTIDDPDATVTVMVTPNVPGDPGEVTVTAEMEVEHLLAKIFGRTSDMLLTTSTAGAGGSTKSLSGDQAFPFAISLDAGHGPGQPLAGKNVGDVISVTLWPPMAATGGFTTFDDGSVAYGIELMQPALAAPPPGGGGGPDGGATGDPYTTSDPYTGGNDPGATGMGNTTAEDLGPGYTENEGMAYIREAMDQALGLSPERDGYRPLLKVGDYIHLKNGAAGAEHLNNANRANVMVGQTLILPVIQGGAPYNSTRKIIAFTSVEVTGYKTAQGKVKEITGRLAKTIVKGRAGQPLSTGDDAIDDALKDISTSVARLITPDTSL